MLEGRIAGLSIQNVTGSFGAAPRINIRGGASIMGNVQPLWVIDGAVYEDLVSLTLDQLASGDAVTLISSAVAGLNASDIEDIQVLKDASATSIYGARALNGVIVITTRSGKRNAPNRFSYSYELSMRSIPSYTNFDLLNSQESMSVYQEMGRKGYFSLQIRYMVVAAEYIIRCIRHLIPLIRLPVNIIWRIRMMSKGHSCVKESMLTPIGLKNCLHIGLSIHIL